VCERLHVNREQNRVSAREEVFERGLEGASVGIWMRCRGM